jgi:uncharacterized protein YeaO (DUF488 family)
VFGYAARRFRSRPVAQPGQTGIPLMKIQIKRAYEPPSPGDGYRVLVDRVWPRGITRESLQVDAWLKDLAPSTALRKWFAHEPEKWKAFKQRYFTELDEHAEEIRKLVHSAGAGGLTLVYAARNEKFNNAAAMKKYIERMIAVHG